MPGAGKGWLGLPTLGGLKVAAMLVRSKIDMQCGRVSEDGALCQRKISPMSYLILVSFRDTLAFGKFPT